MKCLRVRYTGRVQGVGFRWNTVKCSENLDLTGYVKNLSDGSVEVIVQGKSENVDRFLNSVSSVMKEYIAGTEESEGQPVEPGSFQVRY